MIFHLGRTVAEIKAEEVILDDGTQTPGRSRRSWDRGGASGRPCRSKPALKSMTESSSTIGFEPATPTSGRPAMSARYPDPRAGMSP